LGIEWVTQTLETLREFIASSELTSYALGKEAGVSPIAIDRFKIGERSLSLDTADKLARVLRLTLQKPPEPPAQWNDAKRDPATWVLEIKGKVVAEVQQLDNGEWRWQRFPRSPSMACRGLRERRHHAVMRRRRRGRDKP
jgi:transcriptional regulator with XRE-family HTH domain